MKRLGWFLGILVLLFPLAANAVATFVSPGGNIQTAINNANNAAGDSIYLRGGTHTLPAGSNGLVFDVAVTGTTFTNLVFISANAVNPTQHPLTAVVDFDAITSGAAIYGGTAAGVTLAGMTWKGTTDGEWLRDLSLSAYTNWTFDRIVVDNLTQIPFKFTGGFIGTSITISNVTTTANFAALRVVDIVGPATNLDLLIYGVDAMLHNGNLDDAINLVDVRSARIGNVRVFAPDDHGVNLLSSNVAKGIYYIDVDDVFVDGNNITAQPAIYAGNTAADSLHITRFVRFNNCRVEDIASYGLEMENNTRFCEITNSKALRCSNIGIALAEETRDILVENNIVDTVTGSNGGIAIVHGRRHRILRNIITNCERGIRHDEAGGGFFVENERNEIKYNVIMNVLYAYDVSAASFSAGLLANMWGPNVIVTPTTAYARVDGVNKTRAEFVALFPTSIDAPDQEVTGFNLTAYSAQQAANRLVNPNGTAPYTTYSLQRALNLLLTYSSAGLTTQGMLNFITNGID